MSAKPHRPPTTSEPPQAIRFGVGSLTLELPKWLVDKLKRNVVLGVVAMLTVFNLYVTQASGNGVALFAPAASDPAQSGRRSATPGETAFAKTFVFWVPDFAAPTQKLGDPKLSEDQFHKALAGPFGGWSRWRASGAGAGSTGVEDGWIYQASAPKERDELTVRDVQRLIRRHFLEANLYVVEMRHR